MARRVAVALAIGAAVAVVVVAAIAIAAVLLSRSSLRDSPTALARVELGPLAGKLERAVAFAPDGRPIPLAERHGRLTPRVELPQGELVTVYAVIRRPGLIGWALGSVVHERLTVRTPVATITDPWLTLAAHERVRVTFSGVVAAVAVGHAARRPLRARRLSLPTPAPAGAIAIAAAPRSWERLSQPTLVTWFPRSQAPLLVASPSPSTQLSPTASLRLTFSRPVAAILGARRPSVGPLTAGAWSEPNSHTLVFTPSGTGFPLAAGVTLTLPTTIDDSQPPLRGVQRTNTLTWSVAGGSVLRLQQLLAQLGYLPLSWAPSGVPVAQTARAQVEAALAPPAGAFSWRYAATPPSLLALWRPGRANVVTRGAVMAFEADHGLATDGIAGPEVWHALLAAALTGQRRATPYSYVLVTEGSPEVLTLYSGGHVVLRSPANTGIPGRSTQLGTFTVFEHIRVGTMSGRNPDGKPYHDPGIPFISYFNGGDAIHAFPRASYGFPQSLGCVELPLANAQTVWPYTPIGTLVTVTS